MATEEQRIAWANALHLKGVPKECPACGHNGYMMTQALVMMPEYDPDAGTINTESGPPFVSLICRNCGHTRLFHAGVVGIG